MMPDIVEAKALPGYRLWLRFSDGSEGELNLEYLKPFKGVFQPFEDHQKFEEVAVHPEWGTVYWPWGADLDPLVLYSKVKSVPVEYFLHAGALEAEAEVEGEEGYVRLDDFTQVLLSMEQVHENLWAARGRPAYWMCVVIFLHKTLHDLMMLALSGSAGLGALREKTAGQWLETYEKLDDAAYAKGEFGFPKEDLLPFLDLYARIKDSERMLQFTHSRCFVAGDKHDDCMQALHTLRCRLLHTPPGGWSIETKLLQETCAGALEVAAFLVDDANNILWNPCSIQEELSGLLRDSLASLSEGEKESDTANEACEKVQASGH